MQNLQNKMLRSPVGEKSSSNPDLSFNTDNQYVNTRKRKGNPDQDDITSLRTELKHMFNIFKIERENENTKFAEAIEELRAQNKELIKTNSNIEKILEQTTSINILLKEKVDKISTEHEENIVKINILENQVDELQRAQRATMVEIRNIPETKNEDLHTIVTEIHNSLQLPLPPNSLKQVWRLKDNQKTVIAEFQTIKLSKDLLHAVKQYNKLHEDEKFNSKMLNLEGDLRQVYFSESLTPRARKLHYLARDLRRNYNYKYCWTMYGKVFIKQTDSSKAIWIQSEQQIESLKPCSLAQ